MCNSIILDDLSKEPADVIITSGIYSDIEEYVQSLYGWDIEFTQLKRGSGPLSRRTIGNNEFNFMRFRQTMCGEVTGLAVEPGLTFFLGENIADELVMMHNKVSTDTLLCIPQNHEIYTVTPDGYVGYTFNISFSLLERVAKSIYPDICSIRYPESREMYQLSSQYSEFIRYGFRFLSNIAAHHGENSMLCGLETSDVVENLIVPLLISVLKGNVDSKLINTSVKRENKLGELITLINGNLDVSLTMSDLSGEVGLTHRRIQYIFRDNIGISPQTFIKAQRLNAVRRNLSSAAIMRGDVKEIAGKFSFWNMSQFAKDYKDLFGYSPRKT